VAAHIFTAAMLRVPDCIADWRPARRTTACQMPAHRGLDRRRDDPCTVYCRVTGVPGGNNSIAKECIESCSAKMLSEIRVARWFIQLTKGAQLLMTEASFRNIDDAVHKLAQGIAANGRPAPARIAQ
jgi:hypothetical protein